MKKIVLILILFILTGCTAKFNVTIKDKKIEQQILINENNLHSEKKNLVDIIKDSVIEIQNDLEFLSYFDLKETASNTIKSSMEYSIYNYDFDYALHYCYDKQNITHVNNILKIETSNYFNCFDKYNLIDKVNINVTTGYKVLESNADKVDGYTYTWNITKSNKKGIKLVLDTTIDELQEKEIQKEKLNKNIIFIVIGTLVLFAFGTVIFVFIKSNKNNKI